MPPQRSNGTDSEAERPRHAGQYLLEAELGSGGMGIVHLARSASGLRLAVKIVHAAYAQDPEFRGRFRQEVAAARRVSGAFTAPVVDADPDAEHPWMATLFIPGLTLAEHVKRNGALSSARLRHLMAGLAEALRDIHRAGVVHRDLKPSNVLLADDGPKVIDFGISRPSDSELRTETGKLIGTPPFMAPEQFSRPRHVGPAADVFALGSVIVHAATGSGPFDSDSPYLVAYQVVHDEPDLTGVPEEMVDLVSRCLAKEPEKRPTPDELMTALRSASASYDTQAFIPGQRTGKAELDSSARVAPARPGRERPKGSEDRTHVAARKGIRARRRLADVFVFAGILLVCGAGMAAGAIRAADSIGLLGSSRAPEPEPHAERPSRAAFRPWELGLKASGAKAGGQPQCIHAPHALLCVRPGVMAAAIDPDDGKVLWSRSDPGEVSTYSTRAPVLSKGLLLVGSHDGHRLTALDPATGATRWSRDVSRYAGRVAHVAGVVLLSGRDSEVVALDAATGKEKWRHSIPGLALPQFQSYGDGVAYAVSMPVGNRTLVTAVDPATGTTSWQRHLDGALTLVGAHDGTVWFTSTTTDQYTDSVLRYDVTARTSHRTALRIPQAQAQAVVRGATVYLLGNDGSLVSMDTETSKQSWRVETSVSKASAPVVTGHRLYLTAVDGRLIAVDTDRGTLLGQTKARLGSEQGSLVSTLPTPLAADGKIYAAAPDGSLFAVDARDPSAW
jgi:outer membrane protein assembly factor BamB